MDGFLQIRLPVWARAVATRLVAITPCVIVSVLFPSGPALNEIVNIVNSSLSVLLPFALTPLVKVSEVLRYETQGSLFMSNKCCRSTIAVAPTWGSLLLAQSSVLSCTVWQLVSTW